jgi:hypothetical protein
MCSIQKIFGIGRSWHTACFPDKLLALADEVIE